jgi:hypothetical protein
MDLEYYPPGLTPPTPGLPEAAGALARQLRQRAGALRELPSRDVLRGLARVHAAWAADAGECRREAAALIGSNTGYPAGIVDASLRNLFQHLDAASLERWLQVGGVAPDMLDGAPYRAHPVGAFGPRLTVVVSSGNVPGAALPSVVQSLLLKSPTLVKSASAEPFLLPLYAASLARELPELAAGLVVTHWPGGSQQLEAAVLGEAEALIAYGGDDALRSLRRHLPIRGRFIGYGHRLSFSAVSRELLDDRDTAREAARRAAVDLSTFDQQGCYSPQVTYVEAGGSVSPAAFAELLAEELETAEQHAPRRRLDPEESAVIHQYRGGLEMRALGDERVRLWSSGGTRWTVSLSPAEPLHPGPLNRAAVLHPLDDLSELPDLLHDQSDYLLAAALGAPEPRRAALARELALAGVCRICELGSAQFPADAMLHDGVNAIGALARFVTLEGV